MKRKPISTYCRQEVEGWNKLPDAMVLPLPGEEEFCCGFIREEDGVHLMVTLDDLNSLTIIHISLAPIRFYKKDWTDEEHLDHIFNVTPDIVETFFGNRKFARQPDDPRRPQVKHYFAILEVNE